MRTQLGVDHMSITGTVTGNASIPQALIATRVVLMMLTVPMVEVVPMVEETFTVGEILVLQVVAITEAIIFMTEVVVRREVTGRAEVILTMRLAAVVGVTTIADDRGSRCDGASVLGLLKAFLLAYWKKS